MNDNPQETPIPIAAMLPEEISERLGLKPMFRCRQIFSWIHKGVLDISQMTDLPLPLRETLEKKASPITVRLDKTDDDGGGSVKIRLKLSDGMCVESVLLSDDEGRKTACLSCQVGCGMNCAFCRTGQIGYKRDCADFEIVEQFLLLKSLYGDISNIVFMGMGEPMLNFAAVRKAIRIFHDPGGQNISHRKITISTSGIADGIRDLADNGPPVRLAVSLITANPELRAELMPITKSNPLDRLKEALLHYQKTTDKMVTLEIVLLAGVNDGERDAAELVRFVKPLHANVNLIPYNPVPSLPYKTPDAAAIDRFRAVVEGKGVKVTRRYRKGTGINAACGQLGGE
jgi:23S rRNA (adenine2503-C2)-methyltransferase